ncbi:hypothetical protein BY996DRAFT_6415411 [Phakopsora pachyrhizi]|nr:hypothetical protein BY996DRAFT_6415411 [Phakopsora pachyrhizi]
MTEIPTPSFDSNYESFKKQLAEVQNSIEYLSLYANGYVGKIYGPMQHLIKTVLKMLEEHNKGKIITLDASNMRLNEILGEVKYFLLHLYEMDNERWEAGTITKLFIMITIFQVLDPSIKHRYLTTEQMLPWLENLDILQSCAYFLSKKFSLHSWQLHPALCEASNAVDLQMKRKDGRFSCATNTNYVKKVSSSIEIKLFVTSLRKLNYKFQQLERKEPCSM